MRRTSQPNPSAVSAPSARAAAGPRLRAFSLIEVVGVMAVFAVLAAAVAPTFIKRIDAEAKNKEKEMLQAITNGFIRASLESRQIVGLANLPATVGTYLGYSASQVSTTPRGFARQFILDPLININGGTLPYTQGVTGSTNIPINGRILILSTVAKALPTLNPSDTEFAEIWDAAEDTVPAPLSSWGGQGEDLLIARIELASLFHKVVLVNVDASPSIGRFAVNSFVKPWVGGMPFVNSAGSEATRVEAYYMGGTVLNFYRFNANLDTREVVHTDMSFIYQNNKWARRLGGSDDVIGAFGQLVTDFLKPPAPADPKFAATQQAVINEFYSFLYGYSVWAYGDSSTVTNKLGTTISPAVAPYAGAGASSATLYPNYAVAEEARVHMVNFTDSLIH
jgi:type II secretory pathway pseudopilin PulG